MSRKKPQANGPIVIDKADIDRVLAAKRPCPVCLRKTLGWDVKKPPEEHDICPLCGVKTDSRESQERVDQYRKAIARAFGQTR